MVAQASRALGTQHPPVPMLGQLMGAAGPLSSCSMSTCCSLCFRDVAGSGHDGDGFRMLRSSRGGICPTAGHQGGNSQCRRRRGQSCRTCHKCQSHWSHTGPHSPGSPRSSCHPRNPGSSHNPEILHSPPSQRSFHSPGIFRTPPNQRISHSPRILQSLPDQRSSHSPGNPPGQRSSHNLETLPDQRIPQSPGSSGSWRSPPARLGLTIPQCSPEEKRWARGQGLSPPPVGARSLLWSQGTAAHTAHWSSRQSAEGSSRRRVCRTPCSQTSFLGWLWVCNTQHKVDWILDGCACFMINGCHHFSKLFFFSCKPTSSHVNHILGSAYCQESLNATLRFRDVMLHVVNPTHNIIALVSIITNLIYMTSLNRLYFGSLFTLSYEKNCWIDPAVPLVVPNFQIGVFALQKGDRYNAPSDSSTIFTACSYQFVTNMLGKLTVNTASKSPNFVLRHCKSSRSPTASSIMYNLAWTEKKAWQG